jgi:hypothetical protein
MCGFLGWGVGREEGTRIVDELCKLHDIGVDPILAIGTV